MKKVFVIIIFVGILLFLQMGIFSHLTIADSFPNLILLAILSISILYGWQKALPWIILGGIFLDFYSFYNILGISVLALFVASSLVYFLSQNTFKKSTFFSLFLMILMGVLVYNIVLLACFRAFSISFDVGLISFVVGVLYNLIIGLVLFYLLKYVGRFKKVQN